MTTLPLSHEVSPPRGCQPSPPRGHPRGVPQTYRFTCWVGGSGSGAPARAHAGRRKPRRRQPAVRGEEAARGGPGSAPRAQSADGRGLHATDRREKIASGGRGESARPPHWASCNAPPPPWARRARREPADHVACIFVCILFNNYCSLSSALILHRRWARRSWYR